MTRTGSTAGLRVRRHAAALALGFLTLGLLASAAPAADAPVPLVKAGEAVDWWFVFKFNGSSFPACGPASGIRACRFGGKPQPYSNFSQQFVSASSRDGKLTKGGGCVGATTDDPVGATFDQIYNGPFNYVVWNDQLYKHPVVAACSGDSCGAPWGHSKGMLAWNDAGEGVVMQVSTPSWPASGSKTFPRTGEGNTLGCIGTNNVKFSQHFFAMKLNKAGVATVLRAIQNASVVTDTGKAQLVRNGGPSDIRALVDALGKKSKSIEVLREQLSPDVMLISKPSALHVPPWQMVSALLEGGAERSATWWTTPRIYTTTKSTIVKCWDSKLGKTGPVDIALTGHWDKKDFKLIGGSNHAKIGVTKSGAQKFSIFGDMNQQGSASPPPDCGASQNGRGGLFYVVKSDALFDSVTDLIDGGTAPTSGPK